jgi:hypothetical protein
MQYTALYGGDQAKFGPGLRQARYIFVMLEPKPIIYVQFLSPSLAMTGRFRLT